MHRWWLYISDRAAVEAKEIVQRIKTIAKEAPNSRPSEMLETGKENVHN